MGPSLRPGLARGRPASGSLSVRAARLAGPAPSLQVGSADLTLGARALLPVAPRMCPQQCPGRAEDRRCARVAAWCLHSQVEG